MKIFVKNTVIVLILFLNISLWAQSDSLYNQLADSRNKALKRQIDFRFRGGSGEFEKIFYSKVEYTLEARKACVMGIVILSFKVDCNNKMGDFHIKNPLGYGLSEKLGQFFAATEGNWNTCTDEKYSRFEIPIQFILEQNEIGGKGYMVVEGKYPGFKCKSDAYYLEIFDELKAKNKTKKALEALDELVKRDPYNTTYYDLKKEYLGQIKEEKK